MRYFPIPYFQCVGNYSMATREDCAVASDGAHWLFFSTLREGFAGIVSPEGRWRWKGS